jgi:regulator of replication initiation timing
MSIFKYIFDSNWMQRADIERLDEQTTRLHADLRSAGKENRDLAEENEALRLEVSRLVLGVEAMSRLALERNLWSGEDMTRTIEKVDSEDGVADGARALVPKPVKPACAGCGRTVPLNVKRCPHCNKLRNS